MKKIGRDTIVDKTSHKENETGMRRRCFQRPFFTPLRTDPSRGPAGQQSPANDLQTVAAARAPRTEAWGSMRSPLRSENSRLRIATNRPIRRASPPQRRTGIASCADTRVSCSACGQRPTRERLPVSVHAHRDRTCARVQGRQFARQLPVKFPQPSSQRAVAIHPTCREWLRFLGPRGPGMDWI